MKKILVVSTFLVLSAVLASCVPTSKEPISDPAAAKVDERLIGVWMLVSGNDVGTDAVYLHIRAADDKKMDIVWVEHREGIETTHYRVFVSTLGERHYMNVKEWDRGKEKEDGMGYLFAKYDVSRRGALSVWLMGIKEALTDAITSGKLKGRVNKGGSFPSFTTVTIEDTSENIAAFLKSADDKALFESPPMVFKKIREQPAAGKQGRS